MCHEAIKWNTKTKWKCEKSLARDSLMHNLLARRHCTAPDANEEDLRDRVQGAFLGLNVPAHGKRQPPQHQQQCILRKDLQTQSLGIKSGSELSYIAPPCIICGRG